MSFNNRPIETGTRLGSMFLDHFIMTILVVMIAIPEFITSFSNAFDLSHEPSSASSLFPTFNFLSILGFALYFAKDCIQGRSPAKRILKLQLINTHTGKVATPFQCLIRNVLIIIWPVEVIIALITPQKRLGDRLAGTELVYYDPEFHKSTLKWPPILLTLASAYGFMTLLWFLFTLPFNMVKTPMEVNTDSVNTAATLQLGESLEASLGRSYEVDVKVFDEIISREGLKYVSVIISYHHYLDDLETDELQEQTEEVIYSQFPRGSFKGEAKYYYSARGNRTLLTSYF